MTNPWLNIHYADTGSADRTPSLIRIGIGKYFVPVRPGSNFLPGAEMHTSISGLGDYLAQDVRDALRIACEILAQLD